MIAKIWAIVFVLTFDTGRVEKIMSLEGISEKECRESLEADLREGDVDDFISTLEKHYSAKIIDAEIECVKTNIDDLLRRPAND